MFKTENFGNNHYCLCLCCCRGSVKIKYWWFWQQYCVFILVLFYRVCTHLILCILETNFIVYVGVYFRTEILFIFYRTQTGHLYRRNNKKRQKSINTPTTSVLTVRTIIIQGLRVELVCYIFSWYIFWVVIFSDLIFVLH